MVLISRPIETSAQVLERRKNKSAEAYAAYYAETDNIIHKKSITKPTEKTHNRALKDGPGVQVPELGSLKDMHTGPSTAPSTSSASCVSSLARSEVTVQGRKKTRGDKESFRCLGCAKAFQSFQKIEKHLFSAKPDSKCRKKSAYVHREAGRDVGEQVVWSEATYSELQ